MKVRAGARRLRWDPCPPGRGAPPARLARSVGEVEHERTRWYPKMVNYAWAGRSQRKLWWSPEMDGAGASGPYPAVAGHGSLEGYAATSRRAAAVSTEA
ncbi:hypothetical protein DPEC_G00361340 [Dallia pectoralis]|uniref:Uncharacterized protein n=1 Tax=Dallia pectoralis TaxID=75939 RepID=A0ACC2F144_DALPE|nr:hypothetical protein DPEC_G00361340 [Dallia pectoralis]